MLQWFARRMKEAREDEKGFTLIELLVVITLHLYKRFHPPEPRPN
jgi:hypothetical protein